jgi:NADH-quinone oxidoreductase subunit A
MTDLTGHFLIFTVIAVVGLMVPLLIGKFVRPKLPSAEKEAAYECGEPTIGSSYIQFDLRYYVVALLFIVFDVEVAFFFPWATVFGTTTQLADTTLPAASRIVLSDRLLSQPAREPGEAATVTVSSDTAKKVAMFALVDILVFFGVLLVGFAYLWKRGDIDWVRAIADEHRHAAARGQPTSLPVTRPAPQPVGAAH